MLICKKPGDGAIDFDPRRPNRRRSETSRQGGPVFLPRRKLSAIAEAVLRNDQHLSRVDDVPADPVGALQS